MSRFAVAVYCDDIREEVGNKLSLIGVYQGKMFLSAMPALIPKISVAVWIRTPEEEPFQSVKVRLYVNDTKLIEQDVPSPGKIDMPEPTRPLPGDTANVRFHTLRLGMQISPLHVTEPTAIRVRIQTEKEELRAGGLLIELQPKKEA